MSFLRQPWWLVAAVGVALDRITKELVTDPPGFVPTSGISIGRDVNNAGTLGLPLDNVQAMLLGLLVAAAATYMLNAHRGSTWRQLGVWLILGGALSNVVDRLLFGGVVDIISWGRLPRVNLADAMISSGIAALLIDELRPHSKPKKRTRARR